MSNAIRNSCRSARASTVRRRSPLPAGTEVLVADMQVGRQGHSRKLHEPRRLHSTDWRSLVEYLDRPSRCAGEPLDLPGRVPRIRRVRWSNSSSTMSSGAACWAGRRARCLTGRSGVSPRLSSTAPTKSIPEGLGAGPPARASPDQERSRRPLRSRARPDRPSASDPAAADVPDRRSKAGRRSVASGEPEINEAYGLRGLPPVGPAMPVIATAMWARDRSRAPR